MESVNNARQLTELLKSGCFRPVLLRLEHTLQLPEELVKTQIAETEIQLS